MRFDCRGGVRALLAGVGLLVAAGAGAVAEPSSAAVVGFDAYASKVEARLGQQHESASGFIAGLEAAGARDRLRKGELIVESKAPAGQGGLPGAMLHHWRGTAFAPGARAADFEHVMRDFARYSQFYAPQVLRAAVIRQNGEHVQASMRVRQKHVIAVVMDMAYGITFIRVDARRGYSLSRSTRVSEIDAPGTNHERVLGPNEEHGFLWRLNTYWSYEERDGGLYLQVESVTLTRSIPTGLGWVVWPFVESVPRESLEFTLQKTVDAMRK